MIKILRTTVYFGFQLFASRDERGWLAQDEWGDVPDTETGASSDQHRAAPSVKGPNYGDEHTTRKPNVSSRSSRSYLRRSAERTRTGKPNQDPPPRSIREKQSPWFSWSHACPSSGAPS